MTDVPCRHCLSSYFSGTGFPTVVNGATQVIIKAYGPDEQIIYGIRAIIKIGNIKRGKITLLQTPDVQFTDILLANNNGWLACMLPPGDICAEK